MQKLLRALALMMAAMLVVAFVVGCGGDDDDVVVTAAPNFVSSDPATGGTIAANGVVKITFDGPPKGVTVNGTPATVAGNTATWNATGLTAGGTANLAVAWEGGAGTTITLTVKTEDKVAPQITKSTVSNGDKDVEPDPLNTGGITIDLDEDVTGNIKLTLEDGTDVGWIGTVKGKQAKLELVKGKDLGAETTYKIAGAVKDAAGNETKIDITFVTKGKQ